LFLDQTVFEEIKTTLPSLENRRVYLPVSGAHGSRSFPGLAGATMTQSGTDYSPRIKEVRDYRCVEVGDDLAAGPASPPRLMDKPLAIAISQPALAIAVQTPLAAATFGTADQRRA
jgi:hypothetical protein